MFGNKRLIQNSDGTYSIANPAKEFKVKDYEVSFSADSEGYALQTITSRVPTARPRSILTIPGIVAGMNGDKGLMRSHWSNIKKQKTYYGLIIKEHFNKGDVIRHEGPVIIEYIGYKSVLMDWDNFCASFKHIGDSLVKIGIIKDDNPKIVTQFLPEQIKCKRKEQKVVVIITSVI